MNKQQRLAVLDILEICLKNEINFYPANDDAGVFFDKQNTWTPRGGVLIEDYGFEDGNFCLSFLDVANTEEAENRGETILPIGSAHAKLQAFAHIQRLRDAINAE